MKLTIHRGTKEIGGSCVQVTSNGYSILLDAGSPLGDTESPVDITSLDFDDVFISHPHRDHYGMIESLDASKTVHIGELAKELINVPAKFVEKVEPITSNFSTFTNRNPINVGPFRIKPYLMDHSSVDAFGFLVEAEGKQIYYSGDFRTHGPRKKIFEWFKEDCPKDVDVLLMEGTMMGRGNRDYKNEDEVQEGMKTILEQTNGPCFLISSGQHIDRLCRAYGACMSVKPQRKFVTDLYTGFILFLVSKKFKNVPSIISKPNVRVLIDRNPDEFYNKALAKDPAYFQEFIEAFSGPGKRIDFKDVISNGHDYFVKVGNPINLLKVARREKANCSVVYSQWSGYREKRDGNKDYRKFKLIEDLVGSENFHEVHTSGHAVREDLETFSKLLQPKTLIPIHTEMKEKYIDQFDPINVTLLEDGEVFNV